MNQPLDLDSGLNYTQLDSPQSIGNRRVAALSWFPTEPPRTAPTGMESPKVKSAGTTPTAAPTAVPAQRPVAAPGPRIILTSFGNQTTH